MGVFNGVGIVVAVAGAGAVVGVFVSPGDSVIGGVGVGVVAEAGVGTFPSPET